MKAPEPKLYQDQLYGTKVLTPLAVAIVDAPEFQRLSGMRQLGYTEVSYRGARHTRFEHSIGTYFMARLMLRRIVQNHERLGLEHPGLALPDLLSMNPSNSALPTEHVTAQSKWRGLTEVVAAAALMHDLGHIPFGHTLEDEFPGLFPRHDELAGPRLHDLMFDEGSQLRSLFTEASPAWLPRMPNSYLGNLIYVILNWKERIKPQQKFDGLIVAARAANPHGDQVARLDRLTEWFDKCKGDGTFEPFMADIVANTICADLLDYLARDRLNLGMEPRFHGRLLRYLTVREGQLFENEGRRVCIMVTRPGRGGQRRDVATAVLDIMRERYEMVERVYYHHKKAAASAMLVKMLELLPESSRPKAISPIYPAPWSPEQGGRVTMPPNLLHMGDAEFLHYLGSVRSASPDLQQKILKALKFRRRDIYRTLLVIDGDLINKSVHDAQYIAKDLRGPADSPSSAGRHLLEEQLADAAGAEVGTVLLYCPQLQMQAKEADVRVEIGEGRVLPLSTQTEAFAYHADLAVLERYYQEMWRTYVFVDPAVYDDDAKCRAIVDVLCEKYGFSKPLAYSKVRKPKFDSAADRSAVLDHVTTFLGDLPIEDVPPAVAALFIAHTSSDALFINAAQQKNERQRDTRMGQLLDSAILEFYLKKNSTLSRQVNGRIVGRIKDLTNGVAPPRIAAREGRTSYAFQEYLRNLLADFGLQDELPLA